MKRSEKIELTCRAIELRGEGMSLRGVAGELGVAVATLSHWLKKVEAEGGDVDGAFSQKKTKGGRPKAIEFLDHEFLLAKWYRLTKESVDVAAYFFARDEKLNEDGTPRVRPEVRAAMIRYEERALEKGKRIAWPMSVRRAFEVTDEEYAAFRGRKHSQQTEMITRRGMYELLEDGTRIEIAPGDVWELDDYSTNQPYTFTDAETGEVHVGRQVLAAKDLAAASWLGFDHIGRERDAYRAEDVLRFIERLIRSHGMPGTLRLERGIWESSGVHGIEVPGMNTRWGDLRDLMRIEHVFKSKSKSIIEGGFNVLQRWLGHTGLDIGRHRGEFEEATKRLRQAHSTGADPRELGFVDQEESSKLHATAAAEINQRPMARRHLNERVAPADLIARLGWHTAPLRAEDEWYFLPCKKARIVRAGHVEVNPGGGWPVMRFVVNGVIDGLHLDNGHKILVACDPLRPDLGARICNADQTVKNREAYGMGEVLILNAPFEEDAPQFSAAQTLSPHLVHRRKATAAAATTFRSIKAAAAGKVEKTASDGKGKSVRVGTIDRGEHEEKPTAISAPENNPPMPRVTNVVPGGHALPKESRFTRGKTPDEQRAEIEKLKKSLAE